MPRRTARAISQAFVIPLLLVGSLVPCLGAQQKRDSKRPTVAWEALTAQIESALGIEFESCDAQRRWINILETDDATGDGIPEALVEYCHMGAYTSQVALLRLDEHGKPVLAKLRDKNGKAVPVGVFLEGSSVMNGESTHLLSEKHAVYTIHTRSDDSGALKSCSVDAYAWVAKTGTFDFNEALGKTIARDECPLMN